MIVVNLLLVVCGVYVLSLTTKMKREGKIPAFLVSGKVNLERVKDTEGFISYMYPRLLIFGFAVLLFACISLLGEFVDMPAAVSLVSYLAYVALLIYYSIISVRAQNKYLFGGKTK